MLATFNVPATAAQEPVQTHGPKNEPTRQDSNSSSTGAAPSIAKDVEAHTNQVVPPWVTSKEEVIAGMAIAATIAIAPLDHTIDTELQKPRLHQNVALQKTATGLAFLGGPGPFVIVGRYVGPIAYTTAGCIGLARLYQNVHWASDLPLGAVIGTWSGLTIVAHAHAHEEAREESSLEHVIRSATVLAASPSGVMLGWSEPFGH
jgi:hypothetical protein